MSSDFMTLATARYSCRKFTSEQLTEDELFAVLEAGRVAPSARNSQPTRLCVVQSEEGLAKIDECSGCRYGAPTAIVCAYDHDLSAHPVPERGPETADFGDIDTSIAITSMTLAAAELGLATCWVGAFNPQLARKLFNLPDNYRSVEFLMLGHPAMGPGPQHEKRISMDEFVSRESF